LGYDFFLSSPVVDGDGVLIGGGDGVLYRLQAATGAVQWRFQTAGRIRSSPAVAGGTVYAGSMDGRLYAVEAASGRLRWRFDSDGVGIDLQKEGYDRRSIVSSPAVDAGVVTFGTRDGRQYGLEAATGRLLWKVGHPVAWIPGAPEVSWVDGSPAVAAGVAYVGVSDGHFVDAKDLRTGRELWRLAVPGRANASAALAGGVLYAGCSDGNLYAIDAKAGRGLWSFHAGGEILSSPAVAAGVVYFGTDHGWLYAVSDRDAGGRPVPAKAVYFDEALPQAYFRGGKALRAALGDAGYAALDMATLAGFLEARIADRLRSVVVFASDVVPVEMIRSPAGAAGPPLIRSYLEAGGRVVWLGGPPLMLAQDPAVGKLAPADPRAMQRVLGIGKADLDSAAGEEVRAVATAEGIAWGLPQWGMFALPVDAGEVDAVLARDAEGKARAWLKTYGQGGAGAFVRFWGRQEALPDTEVVQRLAEHALVSAP
jgi:hypothetical protein